MKKIGIVICNYNKKEYVLKCIESLQRQTFRDFEIFAVDNASTDGSAEAVAKAYGKAVHLLQLPENLGGTGGFNQGLRQAMAGDFDGFLLLDNDVVLKEDCLEQLVSLMNSREEIGILGCKILRMDEPDTIQEFGPVLDPENVNFILRYRGEKDSLSQPDVLPCDYVPACAMLVRREVVERIGLMPEENFIYYDD
ncbi:MAG: glycosyltransferase family 2 protein, partial [Selenomonas sp.]|nr:glycosyltransferase family 2 protein [Selenomonas sp.]